MKIRTFSLHITAIMFVIAVIIAIAAGHYAFADDGVIASGACGDNAVWTLTGTETDMVLTISGKGNMTDFSDTNIPWISNRGKIREIVVEEGITGIGINTFRGCSNLTSVSLPNSLTSIGEIAFADCSSLTGITIPGNVTSIGRAAFADCSSLTSISIPGRVTTIISSSFSGCSSLTSISIPDSVTCIEDHAFYGCSSLTGICIPNSVTYIGQNAFYGCSSLTSLSIPDSVTYIEEQAFYGCSSLESIIIPDSVITIGNHAFGECDSLKYTFYEGDESQWPSLGFNTNPGIIHYSATWHTWDEEFTTDKKATFEKNGSKSIHCSVCDEVKPDSAVTIPKVTASLSYTSTTYNGSVKAPAVTVKEGTKTLAKGTDYTVTYAAGRKNVGQYKVTVTMKGNYSGSKAMYFKINPKGTTLLTPVAASKAITVRWNKQAAKMRLSTITGYQIQLATDSTFTKNEKRVTVKGYSKVSSKVTKLLGRKRYYIRIRTYKTVNGVTCYSAWSKYKYITTKK